MTRSSLTKRFSEPPAATDNQDMASQITPQQQIVILELIGGANISTACRAANADRRTFHRWSAEPAFRQALEAMLAQVREAHLARVCRIMGKAIGLLEKRIDAGDIKTSQLLDLLDGQLHDLPISPRMTPATAPALLELRANAESEGDDGTSS